MSDDKAIILRPESSLARDPLRAAAEEADRQREEEAGGAGRIGTKRPATALECLEADRPLGYLLARLPRWCALTGFELMLDLVSYDAAKEGPSGGPRGRGAEHDASGLWAPNTRERQHLRVGCPYPEAALVKWLQEEIDRGRDVAVCSRVERGFSGAYLHLPCYDFAWPCPSPDGVHPGPWPNPKGPTPPGGTRERATYRINSATLVWFASGRSYHAYDERGPVPFTTWTRLMGGALSLNCGGAEVLDHSWLAFALARGYAALRVTRTCPDYQALPKKTPWPPKWGEAEDRP